MDMIAPITTLTFKKLIVPYVYAVELNNFRSVKTLSLVPQATPTTTTMRRVLHIPPKPQCHAKGDLSRTASGKPVAKRFALTMLHQVKAVREADGWSTKK
jgi:hypothetical protein